MKETDITVNLLKQEDEKTIRDIYNEYRPGFLLFANRYNLGQDRTLDVYQDAIIALCENAQKGHLDELSSSLKTYLFSIGKYMIFAELRKNKKKIDYENIEDFQTEWIEYSEERNDEEIKMLRKSLTQLGAKCQEILKLFYFQEKNLDEITNLMEYENKNVAKSQKSRCIRRLKEIITSIQNE